MSENKKYELLKDDTITTSSGKTLYRIKALVAIGLLVAPGELGGYIENEKNLSIHGSAWISENACVFDCATVCGEAFVYGNAKIYENAKIYGNAQVYGEAQICGDAEVFGYAQVYGGANVYGNAIIEQKNDIQWFMGVGPESRALTVFRAKNDFLVNIGSFYGTLSQFKKAVKVTHGDSKYGRHYAALINAIEIWFGEE